MVTALRRRKPTEPCKANLSTTHSSRSMPTVADVSRFFESYAPPQLAEDWDNVGLLVGDLRSPVSRLMTCLTITPASAAEAIRERAEVIVTHHPLPFRPLKRITCET